MLLDELDPHILDPQPEGGPQYLVSIDLGKSRDFTALSVVSVEQRPEDKQNLYQLRHLERWDLGTSYLTIAADVCRLLVRRPIYGRTTLIIDATGVGSGVRELFEPESSDTHRAFVANLPASRLTESLTTDVGLRRVLERLRAGDDAFTEWARDCVAPGTELQVANALRAVIGFAGLVNCIPIMLTGGAEYRIDWAINTYFVPKRDVVASTNLVLQARRIRMAPTIPHMALLQSELQGFSAKPTPAGNETYEARDGEHDDLVLSLALALWTGENQAQWDPSR